MSPIKVVREKKRIEINPDEVLSTNVIVVRDHALLKAQQENPLWSIDAEGEIASWFSPRSRTIIVYIPMMKFEVVSE